MTTYSVYFAGDLFDHKHLAGNAILAEAIGRRSTGGYVCVLPQDLEQASGRMVDIRNQDLKQVMACDVGLFNFDGTDLDSGTVVEFMMAKMLDIPAVILRSDFRASGDQEREGDDWNLMCSFYPRSRKVQFNAMAWYQEARRSGEQADWSDRLYDRIADAVIDQLDAVRAEPSLFDGDDDRIGKAYAWATRFPGSGFDGTCESGWVEEIIAKKRGKGLI